MNTCAEPVFAAPWEARVFATMVHLREQGLIAWPDFADALASAVREAPARAYYESWLAAAERLLSLRGLLDAAELESAAAAAAEEAAHAHHAHDRA
jgi:nitrile hydratase accessory protein